MSDVVVFLISIALDIISLFITVYFIVTLSDLECDYINARSCCEKLNKFVIPELIIKLIPSVIFLFTGHWIVLLLNLPLIVWYAYKFYKKPLAHVSYFDPAEIHNRGELKIHVNIISYFDNTQ